MILFARFSILLLIVTVGVLDHVTTVNAQIGDTVWKGFSISCLNKDEFANVSISCHGIRLVRRIVQKMLEETQRKKSLEILDGVSLVENEEMTTSSARNPRVLQDFGYIQLIMGFLQSRELRIKLRSLLPDNLEAAVNASLPAGRGHGNKGGGGGKKGDNGMMILALMMGKMMAAMGFGALGLMAMKALMVSSIALMLSLIVAAKKLSSKDEESHHIVYAQEHHRRKRSWSLMQDDSKNQPYRGYFSKS